MTRKVTPGAAQLVREVVIVRAGGWARNKNTAARRVLEARGAAFGSSRRCSAKPHGSFTPVLLQ